MQQDTAAFAPYRAEVLFLLVGGNPLPNYVSAQLMAKEHGAIYLLATPGTEEVAKRLKCKLKQAMREAQIEIASPLMPEVGGFEIEQALTDILRQVKIGNRRVGLNYTGGTKDMAVHVYDRLQDEFGKHDAVFSYLDAHTLEMGIYVEGQRTQWPSAKLVLTPSLEDLWQLHGLMRDPEHAPPVQRPSENRKDLVASIAEIHSTPAGFRQWRQWLAVLKNAQPGAETLPTQAEFAALAPFVEQLARACNTPQPAPTEVAAFLGKEVLRKCDDFLRGKWLEEWALWALLPLLEQNNLHDHAMNLFLRQPPDPTGRKPQPPAFELDVAAIKGYQLHLFSCIATEGMDNMSVNDKDEPKAGDRGEAKRHLFEAYMRARQVGGDEARVALVSCVINPEKLEAEVTRDWDAEGKIKVFGRPQLLSLSDAFADWFRTANRPRLQP